MFDQTVGPIRVRETEDPPCLVNAAAGGILAVCPKFTPDFMLRKVVYDKLVAAQGKLPDGYSFLLYEAYRPRSRQLVLWDAILEQLKGEHPDWTAEALATEAAKFVANPYGFGSGHQSGAAVDITLRLPSGEEAFMGTAVQEFCPKTTTDTPLLTPEERRLRALLRDTLESEGVINYPEEWWHFSYGDRLWAEITGRTEAFLAPIQDS